jgi:hypothetical protein
VLKDCVIPYWRGFEKTCACETGCLLVNLGRNPPDHREAGECWEIMSAGVAESIGVNDGPTVTLINLYHHYSFISSQMSWKETCFDVIAREEFTKGPICRGKVAFLNSMWPNGQVCPLCLLHAVLKNSSLP